MKVDYHVHTIYSDDSWYLMEDVIKDAIEMGLDEICFTDHVDYGVKPDWENKHLARQYKGEPVLNVDYPRYFDEFRLLKSKYKDQINLKIGLEFGIQMHTISQFQKIYDTYEMDFVLLSIHQVEDQEFWTGDFQKGKTELESYDRYYEEMHQVIHNYSDYSCLAHMDLVRRYLVKENDQFERCKPMIEKILKKVIADGKGIEINTSSIRYEVPGLTPSVEILKLYKALGGTIITIGSDSHNESHLGFGVEEAKDILKELGFTSFCTFDKMKPQYHTL